MYNVQVMKHMKVAEARARFGEVLDRAEQGSPVVIERNGVLFRVTAERTAPSAPKGSLFSFVDTAVLTGNWTWKTGRKGLVFAPRRKAR